MCVVDGFLIEYNVVIGCYWLEVVENLGVCFCDFSKKRFVF